MASQQTAHNRRSLSILGHLRSLSRMSIWPEHIQDRPDVEHRSHSSMSCNPHQQQPPSLSRKPMNVEKIQQKAQSITTTVISKPSISLETPPPPYRSHPRPRSWQQLTDQILPGHSGSGRSTRLFKGTKSLPIDRRTISEPALVTTNHRVAKTESIMRSKSLSLDHGTRNGRQRNTKRSRLRKMMRSMQNRRMKSNRTATAPNLDIGKNSMSAIETGIARRKAETINLCREKICRLTGDIRQRRRASNDAYTSKNSVLPSSLTGNTQASEHQQEAFVSEFGSLTRSFASAIERLDLLGANSPAMGLVKSASSLLRLRKSARDSERHSKLDIAECEQQAADSHFRMQKALKDAGSDPCQHLFTAQASKPFVQYPVSDLAPQVFDTKKNSYVRCEPFAGYPSGIDPLRMHPHINGFASRPVNNGVVSIAVQGTSIRTDEDEDVIDNAPIYSPSSGNLSQYSRDLSTLAALEEDRLTDQDTPTRLPGENQRGFMKRIGIWRSKSGLSLLQMHRTKTNRSNNKWIKRSHSIIGLFKKAKDELTDTMVERPRFEMPTSHISGPLPLHSMTSPKKHAPRILTLKRNKVPSFQS